MFRETAVSSSQVASPLGIIPIDFPRLDELCKFAHIRYRNETLPSGEQYRNWSVVVDGTLTSDGKTASTRFKKAAMYLDYLVWKFPDWNRTMLLTELLDQRDLFASRLSGSWLEMHNELAKMGCLGYEIINHNAEKVVHKKSFDASSLPDL